jgi:hypothetical protein
MTTNVASQVPPEDETFPFISTELINALDKRYPESSPIPGQYTQDELMFTAGKRDLVRWLKLQYDSQDDSDTLEPPF